MDMSRFVKYCCIVLLLLPMGLKGQASKSDLESRKKALQEEIRQTSQLILETRKNKTASLSQLKALNKKLADRMRLINTIQTEINLLNTTITSNSKRIQELQFDLSRMRETYSRLVKRAYMNRNQRSALLLFFSAQNIQQAYKRLYYLKTYTTYRKEQARLIEYAQNELSGKMQVLRTDLNSKQTLLGNEEQEKKELSIEKKEQESTLSKLQKKEKTLKKELIKKEATKKKLDAEIRKVIEREIARERAAVKAREAKAAKASASKPKAVDPAKPAEKRPTPTPEIKMTPETAALSGKFEANQGKLPWPVDKGAITETFGTHAHPVLKGITTYNNGIDIATSKNAPVKAIYEGEVMGVVSIPGSGDAILIKHGEYLTVYSNLGRVVVEKGQKVKTGTVIGNAGENDEGVTEAHLEIWKGKTKLNPALWIAR
jgi:septal ring factor EnvC (AmiA/AmiB activator)